MLTLMVWSASKGPPRWQMVAARELAGLMALSLLEQFGPALLARAVWAAAVSRRQALAWVRLVFRAEVGQVPAQGQWLLPE
jgi:hypothetical protein